MPKRKATTSCFRESMEFCTVHVTVESEKIEVCGNKGLFINESPDGKELRFGPYGMIQHVPLGELRCTSSSAFSFVGVIIDYLHNIEDVMKYAVSEAERLKSQQIGCLADEIKKLSKLSVVIIK